MTEAILKYQEKDREKFTIERELLQSQVKKASEEARHAFETARSKCASLESAAKSASVEYDGLTNSYNSMQKSVAKAADIKPTEDETQIVENLEDTNLVINGLVILERKLVDLARKMDGILQEIDVEINRAKNAKAKFEQYKTQIQKLEEESKQKISSIDSELKTLEKAVDVKLLEKYKARRADRLFPVFVPLAGMVCGGCGMEVGLASLSKIKAEGFYPCEQCRRLIYSK